MGKVFIEETTLTAIGNAIREQTGKSDLISPANMPTEIKGIESGGSSDSEILLSGNGSNAFYRGNIFTEYFDKIRTENLNDVSSMFYSCDNIENIPFEINCDSSVNTKMNNMFDYCSYMKEPPKINYANPSGNDTAIYIFRYCRSIRKFPEGYFDNWVSTKIKGDSFSYCFSLREFPIEVVDRNYHLNCQHLMYLTSLDGVYNMPVSITLSMRITEGYFNMFNHATRLKYFTFEKDENNNPIVIPWCNRTIDLSKYVGYSDSTLSILNYNSGITADKEVKDDTTYQALKNDPDWFSCDVAYSRYNHDSAVETINSLPDATEYIASSSGNTNTIKFKGASGSATDGGAINTMTEEEIAVAAAKGWTVSFV